MTKVPISDIVVNRTTYIDDDAVERLAKIATKQQLPPLIIDHHGTLIDGLTRLEAYKRLGAVEVDVNIAITAEQAVELLRSTGLNYRELDLRRLYDIAEAFNDLLRERARRLRQQPRKLGQLNNEQPLRGNGARDYLRPLLGRNWDRIRAIYRWYYADPADPRREQLIEEVETGVLAVNRAYYKLGQRRERNPLRAEVQGHSHPNISIYGSGGDIRDPRGQLHLLEEFDRQLSGAIKGAKKMGLPLVVSRSEAGRLLREITNHRSEINRFIKFLRRGIEG